MELWHMRPTPGIRHGQHFWLSGQIAIDGRRDITSQTEGALAKIDALLEAGGLSKDDICFAQFFSIQSMIMEL